MNTVDKSRYGASAFKANKSVQSNALRFCYESRSLLCAEDCSKPSVSFLKYLDRLQQILTADKSVPTRTEIADVFAQDALAPVLISGLHKFDFETAKQLLALLITLLSASPRLQAGLCAASDEVVPALLSGYTSAKLYIICGQLFREMLQYPDLCRKILSLPTLSSLAAYSKSSQFEVSADAFESFKVLLSSENDALPEFLAMNYIEVEELLQQLQNTDNYFLKRQSLALIARLLAQGRNAHFRAIYARDPEHLKAAMTTLKSESSRQVKVESFYVLGEIVAALQQQGPVAQAYQQNLKILRKNKERLVAFVQQFGQDIEEEQFQTVKQRLLENLQVV